MGVGLVVSSDRSESTFCIHWTDFVHSSVALTSDSQELRLLRFSLWLFQISGPFERKTRCPQINCISLRLTWRVDDLDGVDASWGPQFASAKPDGLGTEASSSPRGNCINASRSGFDCDEKVMP